MWNKIKKGIRNPRLIALKLLNTKLARVLSDKIFINLEYRLKMKKKLNLNSPKTYNEKLQYLKLYDRKEEYTDLVDKIKVRDYIEKEIGSEYLIPVYGFWNSYEEIDFNKLPKSFVLKPNHTSGDVFICHDKSKINHKDLKKEIKRWLKRKYYWVHREWPYKNIEPQIYAEKLMKDNEYDELLDYKFFCFDGKPELMYVASERHSDSGPKFDFFDLDFKRLDIVNGYPNSEAKIEKPRNFEKMIQLARQLSINKKHVRVDFYECNGNIYFGELTFYHFSGATAFVPEKWDYILGDKIKL